MIFAESELVSFALDAAMLIIDGWWAFVAKNVILIVSASDNIRSVVEATFNTFSSPLSQLSLSISSLQHNF